MRPSLFSGVNAPEHFSPVKVEGARSAEPDKRLGVLVAISLRIFPPDALVALQKLKDRLNWTEEPFDVPEDVKEYCRAIAEEKSLDEENWNKLFENYSNIYPELADSDGRVKSLFARSIAVFKTFISFASGTRITCQPCAMKRVAIPTRLPRRRPLHLRTVRRGLS